jgi:hypothetical protein
MKRLSTVLLVGLGAASLVGAGSAGKAPPTPKGLLLWNTLGSAHEVTHSAFGPNLVMFNCHAKRAPHFGRRCSIDIRGKLAFVDGPSSKAALIGGGPYFPEARVHTALLRKSILNPEHGAIEAWYWQKKDPEPFKDNPHRIFAGGYNLGGAGDVNLQVQDRVDSGDPRLHLSIFFGRNKANPTIIWARSTVDHHIGYPISSLTGQWIHVAGVWDRHGIDGSTDTVRLYVNGKVVALSHKRNWGRVTCGMRKVRCWDDIVGCNDTCAGAFAVDDLKIWDYAKTEFSAQGT